MKNPQHLLWPFVLVVLLLLGLGIGAIAATDSSVPGSAFFRTHVGKQAAFALAGIGLFMALCRLPYTKLRAPSYFFYGGFLVSLVLVLKFAPERNGARRWFEFAGFGVQPSEYMKLAVILALARYLHVREPLSRLRHLLVPLLLVLVPMALILKQPDLGTALVFFPIFLSMVFVAGAPKQHLAFLCGVSATLAVAPFVIYFTTGRVPPPLKEYQMRRLVVLIHPKEAAIDEVFQIDRSLKAIGAGGITGRGPDEAATGFTRNVPERHNDFIFAVVGESWGLLGTTSVLLLYGLLLGLALSVAFACRDPFGRLLIVGVVASFSVQVCVNIAMTIGLAPVTGMTLPLVSYGGSSLLCSCAALGMVATVGRHFVPVFSHEDVGLEKGQMAYLSARPRGKGDLAQPSPKPCPPVVI